MCSEELELAKEGVKEIVKQTFAPVQEIVSKLAGPSASELGLMFRDHVRVWRLKNAIRLFDDVRQVAADAHLTLNPVAPRLLFPILEAGSLEEDGDLHRRWVALLTNSARMDLSSPILPGFPDILKQLLPEEALFLDAAYDEVVDMERRSAEILEKNPGKLGYAAFGLSGRLLSTIHPVQIENLERLMLVTRNNVALSLDDKQVNVFPPANHLFVTQLGKAFVLACRLPPPREG